MAERLAPALALVLNAFVWGVSWWPFRELQSLGLHPLWATALVYLFCLGCALAVRPGALAPFAREPRLWLLAAACGLTNVGFNWGVTVGDVVRVVLLFYLMPAWSVLLAWPLLGERPTPPALVRLALGLVGVLTVLHSPGAGWPVPRDLADWLALAGGFSFALTNILLRLLRNVPTESRVVAMFGGGAALAALAALAGLVALPAPAAGWIVLALALGVAFLASNLCLQYGASRLAAHTTALVMLSEVVFASLSSVLLGAAELTPRVAAGGALILAAAAWAAWPSRAPRIAGAQSPS
ncbi:MAG: DMT family transporter [Burkholderiales bacterium]|nr:DMT family transporter [Burkholderiales bacterium]